MRNKLTIMLCGLTAAALHIPMLSAAEPSVQPLAEQAARSYQQEARYPEWSRVVEAGKADPVMAERIPTRQSLPGPDGSKSRLEVWSDSVVALPGDAVTLHVRLDKAAAGPVSAFSDLVNGNANGPAPIQQVSADIIGESSGLLGTVRYTDNGNNGDLVAGDGIFTAIYQPPADQAPELGFAEAIMVNTLAVLEDGEFWEATGGFVYSNPAARATGRVTEDIRDGSMLLGIELEVLAPGRVYVAGTLADNNGAPFVTAQQAGFFEPGVHTLELSFYGLAFHERDISGTVSLDSLVVTSANGIPNAIAPAMTNLHISAPLTRTAMGDLTDQPFNDLNKLDSAQRLLETVQNRPADKELSAAAN